MENYDNLLQEVDQILEGNYKFTDDELNPDNLDKQRKEMDALHLKSQKILAMVNVLSAKKSLEKLKSAKDELNS